ncbi:MAG: 5-(carboxyamino)imidazole ribonucleotide mutase [Planctomycetota bacterium]
MTALVGIVMGSDSDLPHLEPCMRTLNEFGIGYCVDVISAHRTPADAHAYGSSARERGLKVIIAAAGGAAHLAGVMASLTTLPVIGIPIPATMDGLDALLSTVQMPAGVPVATVAAGPSGGTNAAVLAAQILGTHDPAMAEKLRLYKEKLAASVREKNRTLKAKLG